MRSIFLHFVRAAKLRWSGRKSYVDWPDAVRISGLRAVKHGHGGNVVNKAGRVVLRGNCDGKDIKVYEASSNAHARFIASVSTLKSLQAVFPECVGCSGRFVAAKWITGHSIRHELRGETKQDTLVELAKLQALINAVAAAELPNVGFDYWHEMIRKRFMRAMELAGELDFANEIVANVDRAWESTCKVLIHPDVTPGNVVRRVDGSLAIIDNELLSTSGMPLVDMCNTLRALGREDAVLYRDTYMQSRDHQPTAEELTSLQCFWLARCAGSDFVAGDIATVCRRVELFKTGRNNLPFEP